MEISGMAPRYLGLPALANAGPNGAAATTPDLGSTQGLAPNRTHGSNSIILLNDGPPADPMTESSTELSVEERAFDGMSLTGHLDDRTLRQILDETSVQAGENYLIPQRLDPSYNTNLPNDLDISSSSDAVGADQEALDKSPIPLPTAKDYLGKLVEVGGDTLVLSGGEARITYDLLIASEAAETTIEILDKDGQVLRTFSGETAAGRHELLWDGKDDAGNDLADGLYTFRVKAIDSDGSRVPVFQGMIGRVTNAELADGKLMISIGELIVSSARAQGVIDAADWASADEETASDEEESASQTQAS